MAKLILALLIFAAAGIPSAAAKHLHLEKEFQRAWCEKERGTMEVVLDDGARVDCLTDEYAVEFDFAAKWAESIGQSLYYAQKTGKKPAVMLIMEKPGDERFAARLNAVAEKHGITVWTMKVASGNQE